MKSPTPGRSETGEHPPNSGPLQPSGQHRLRPIEDAEGPERYECSACHHRVRFEDEGEDTPCLQTALFDGAA